jgi:hypothetical protein
MIAATSLRQEGITSIDVLEEVGIEGAEDRILNPFFRDAEELWPKFLIIEDTRNSWSKDLFSALPNMAMQLRHGGS